MNWIKRAWRGEEKLWKVFWLYDVLVGFGFNFIDAIIKNGFGSKSIEYILFDIMYFVYAIWLFISLWRCAFNTEWKFFSYIARIFAVLPIILIMAGLLIGGGLIGHDFSVAAECKKELKEYKESGGTDLEGFAQKCIQDHSHKAP